MSQESLQPDAPKILVIDDHELVLDGTINVLRKQYPISEILIAQTAQMALLQLQKYQPNLIVMALSIPETSGKIAQIDTGILLLKTFMESHPTLNIVVQSTYVRSLVRIRPNIDAHKGGFTVADKSLSCSWTSLRRGNSSSYC